MAFLQLSNGQAPVEYKEYVRGSQEESYTDKSARATRIFTVKDWFRRWEFVAELLGYSYLQNVGNKQYVRRIIPSVYPLLTSSRKFWMYARNCSRIEGLGPKDWVTGQKGVQFGRYKQARVTINYESLGFPVRNDDSMPTIDGGFPDESSLQRYVTRVFVPATDFFQLPYGAYSWVSDNQPTAQTFGRMISRLDTVYTYHAVPGVPLAVFTHLGKLNNAIFDGVGPETMYLTAIEMVPYRDASGQRVFDFNYRMRYFLPDGAAFAKFNGNPVTPGHNCFLRYLANNKDVVWDRPIVPGPSNKPVFDSADFSLLFKGPFSTTFTNF